MGYTISEERYSATALTVSAELTPYFAATARGFECDAYFPPEQLTDRALSGTDVIDGRVRVRVVVDLKDVLRIVPLG